MLDIARRPVRELAQTTIVSVSPDTDVDEACRALLAADVSALLVVGRDGAPGGVLSRRDLLEVGRVTALGHGGGRTLELPARAVGDLMSHPVITVPAEASIGEAAAVLVERRIHRVFLVEEDRAVGVFSTRDAMLAVRAGGVRTPLSRMASSAVVTIDIGATLSQAVHALEQSGKGGVVVTDGGLPVGVFGEADAIAARDLSPEAPIEERIDPSLLLLPAATPAFRAAAFAVATRARRIVLIDERHHPRGLVTGLDFCRLLVGAPNEPERGVAAG